MRKVKENANERQYTLDIIDLALIDTIQEGWFPFGSKEKNLTYEKIANKVDEKVHDEKYRESIREQVEEFNLYTENLYGRHLLNAGTVKTQQVNQSTLKLLGVKEDQTVTARMVQFRLKRMIEKRIIRGFYPDFSTTALGLSTSAIVQVTSPSPSQMKKTRLDLFEQLRDMPNVEAVVWTTGKASFFIIINTVNNYWLGFIIQKMKAEFIKNGIISPIDTETSIALVPPLRIHKTSPLLGSRI